MAEKSDLTEKVTEDAVPYSPLTAPEEGIQLQPRSHGATYQRSPRATPSGGSSTHQSGIINPTSPLQSRTGVTAAQPQLNTNTSSVGGVSRTHQDPARESSDDSGIRLSDCKEHQKDNDNLALKDDVLKGVSLAASSALSSIGSSLSPTSEPSSLEIPEKTVPEQPEISLDDLTIKEYRNQFPEELKVDFYDAMILYQDGDRKAVERFLYRVNSDVMLNKNIRPKVVLYDDILPYSGMSPIGQLDRTLPHCTYVFLYVTKGFCQDGWTEFSSQTCLMNAIDNMESRWSVVPIFTEPKRQPTFRVPPSIRSLKGIQYWSDDKFYVDSLRKLLEDKVHHRLKKEEELEHDRKIWIIKKREEQKRIAEERRQEEQFAIQLEKARNDQFQQSLQQQQRLRVMNIKEMLDKESFQPRKASEEYMQNLEKHMVLSSNVTRVNPEYAMPELVPSVSRLPERLVTNKQPIDGDGPFKKSASFPNSAAVSDARSAGWLDSQRTSLLNQPYHGGNFHREQQDFKSLPNVSGDARHYLGLGKGERHDTVFHSMPLKSEIHQPPTVSAMTDNVSKQFREFAPRGAQSVTGHSQEHRVGTGRIDTGDSSQSVTEDKTLVSKELSQKEDLTEDFPSMYEKYSGHGFPPVSNRMQSRHLGGADVSKTVSEPPLVADGHAYPVTGRAYATPYSDCGYNPPQQFSGMSQGSQSHGHVPPYPPGNFQFGRPTSTQAIPVYPGQSPMAFEGHPPFYYERQLPPPYSDTPYSRFMQPGYPEQTGHVGYLHGVGYREQLAYVPQIPQQQTGNLQYAPWPPPQLHQLYRQQFSAPQQHSQDRPSTVIHHYYHQRSEPVPTTINIKRADNVVVADKLVKEEQNVGSSLTQNVQGLPDHVYIQEQIQQSERELWSGGQPSVSQFAEQQHQSQLTQNVTGDDRGHTFSSASSADMGLSELQTERFQPQESQSFSPSHFSERQQGSGSHLTGHGVPMTQWQRDFERFQNEQVTDLKRVVVGPSAEMSLEGEHDDTTGVKSQGSNH